VQQGTLHCRCGCRKHRKSGDRQSPLHCRRKRYSAAPVPQQFPPGPEPLNEKRRRLRRRRFPVFSRKEET
jgi:hypothetical protein